MGSFWNQRWLDIEQSLQRVDWPHFRRESIVKFIQTMPSKLEEWHTICLRDGVPLDWAVDSTFGDPIGEFIDGKFFTASSLRHAHQAYRILSRWSPHQPITIVEVGAGYGGFPRIFHRLANVVEYCLVDAAPILAIQKHYLNVTTGFDRFRYLEPGEPWPDCDLVLNSNSFAEMDPTEVTWYFAEIQSKLREGGRLYLTNRVHHQTDFGRYPYDGHWDHDVTEQIDGMFVECLSERRLDARSEHPAVLLRDQVFP
jgi:hypothetical protein